jgi:hypothetical protein
MDELHSFLLRLESDFPAFCHHGFLVEIGYGVDAGLDGGN